MQDNNIKKVVFKFFDKNDTNPYKVNFVGLFNYGFII